jgi:hypothetical protein
MGLQAQNPDLSPATKHLRKQLGWMSTVVSEEHEVFATGVDENVDYVKSRYDLEMKRPGSNVDTK